MTDINHVAADKHDATKAGWVKPAIVSFVPAVESRSQVKGTVPDAGASQS